MSFETPSTAGRMANIQSLRGLAALLVLLSHLFIIERKYGGAMVLPKSFDLGMVGVDLFFAISGFIMVYVIWHMGRGGKSMAEFLFARAARIYPIYWLISGAVLALYLARPDMVFSSYDSPPNIVKSFTLFPDKRDPLLAVGWTLIHEMGFYFVIAPLLLMKRGAILPYLVVWALVLTIVPLLGGYANGAIERPIVKLLFSPLSYEFLAGALAGWCFVKFGAQSASPALWLGALVLIAVLYYHVEGRHSMPDEHWMRAAYFAVPSALLVYGLAGWTRVLPRCTQVLGDWSYTLYLTHVLSLSIMGKVWKSIGGMGGVDNAFFSLLALIAMGAGAIAASGLVYKFAEKPMLKAAKRLRRLWFPPA